MTKTKERQALTYEIKARENLLKRLEYPRKQLESAVKKGRRTTSSNHSKGGGIQQR